MEEPKKISVEMRVNIKHDLTGIMYERGTDNSNYHLDQRIEVINRSSRKMETLLQGAKIVTRTGNSNNYDENLINKTHDYHG